MEFSKYEPWGNDIIVIDPAIFHLPLTPERIRLICHRHFGVGGDGISYGPIPEARFPNTLRFFNPDGSEAEKSGNGMRAFARHLVDAGYEDGVDFPISIGGGAYPVKLLNKRATRMKVGMGMAQFRFVEELQQFGEEEWIATAVSVGNPHCVINSEQLDLIHHLGPSIETAPQFPHRTNVELYRVVNEHTIQVEIWERGAGYTLASGSCSTAAAVTAVKTGRVKSPVTVQMVGGEGIVEIDENWGVQLTGDVNAVYKGVFSVDFIRQLNGLRNGT